MFRGTGEEPGTLVGREPVEDTPDDDAEDAITHPAPLASGIGALPLRFREPADEPHVENSPSQLHWRRLDAIRTAPSEYRQPPAALARP
ncbi:hypothetical protein SAV14893_053420 [Streptomyces avermitilis]|uniref:Uncharacterized protein n=1 Tax=Streptomyces avermitilis TaxID=33903 RepID=A0A4D4MQ87_STRAX|nr:hypothetical protein SAVMC3_65670 [Streptomyces avermitilis]GDY65949.1 hypothetical protein SAV14893_053420 [Streptomyces avermitilis]GDY73834.1 hypothetical protein SAV31267_033190 [Streptomyces avermitilis]GDY82915.1 hypothetical protein SAVCW2_21140 [Streptomyces avermitilis]